MKDLKTNVGVDFVFFDGEEYIFDPDRDHYFFGSKHFAQEYRQCPAQVPYVGAVLLDMIAGKNAHVPGRAEFVFPGRGAGPGHLEDRRAS